jgi:hypothetical protein
MLSNYPWKIKKKDDNSYSIYDASGTLVCSYQSDQIDPSLITFLVKKINELSCDYRISQLNYNQLLSEVKPHLYEF